MAVLKSEDGKELLVDCEDGCNEGMRFKIDPGVVFDSFCFISYTSGNWYRDQSETFWDVFCKKLKKL